MTYTPITQTIFIGSDGFYYFKSGDQFLPEGGCASMTEAILKKMEGENAV
jgi:hypothetical protein